jgi:MYXO-CTERM domain-containing protein
VLRGTEGPVVPSVVTDGAVATREAASARGLLARLKAAGSGVGRTVFAFGRGLAPEWRDVVVYGGSAVFAAITAFFVGISLYRQWGQMAVGPYVVATLLMAAVAWRAGRARRVRPAGAGRAGRVCRVVAFLIVLFGATVVPLALEVAWRSDGNAAAHVQPEVVVVEQAGARAAHGRDPYRVIDRDGHVVVHQHAEPTYELYYPYLPGMVLFGVSSGSDLTPRLTDARIQFLVFSVLVTLVALSRLRPSTDARWRSLQFLTVLPTAALPFATGGDDMPVAALMLLGLVALQRRRPMLAGLALGAASSLKFTAWPLALFALWAARDRSKRRSIGHYVLGAALVVVPVVLPVALRNPSAFVDNVFRFPLGLAGVSSPAASALPGHILIAVFPSIHKAYVVVAAILGLAVLVRHLWRHPPSDPAGVATLTGWVMLLAILLAPATRVGYLLYPINLFVWAWMLRRAEEPALARPAVDQVSSGISKTSTEYGVMPAAVVGETVTPASQ